VSEGALRVEKGACSFKAGFAGSASYKASASSVVNATAE